MVQSRACGRKIEWFGSGVVLFTLISLLSFHIRGDRWVKAGSKGADKESRSFYACHECVTRMHLHSVQRTNVRLSNSKACVPAIIMTVIRSITIAFTMLSLPREFRNTRNIPPARIREVARIFVSCGFTCRILFTYPRKLINGSSVYHNLSRVIRGLFNNPVNSITMRCVPEFFPREIS